MINSQEIREKTFEKAVIGGYDMAGVDDFMEEVANDVALLQKENATLRGKMKVLAKSIEEYRSNEDALRMALISAQKLSTMIELEARDKSESIISDANTEAAKIIKEAKLMVELESARLSQAQRSSAQFIESMNLLCRKQLEYLEKISESDTIKEAFEQASKISVSAPRPTEDMHETVRTIEETVAKAADEPTIDVKPELDTLAQEQEDEELNAPTKPFNVFTDSIDDDDAEDSQFLFDGFGER